ncbi:hypothetical protein CBR_g30227 [Chara braunii]|uniref:DNA replication licensing factor MCM2 n=1 Tax=Chara braunii TaxID=69332 RepID=A0A388LCB5_CHABU|nr:hypothetical protein CBR_g30227 [Chara braunii]|eukprot:GBG79965.1 hypothetical protein CBR_g30227 [Chara braunii]
MASCSKRPVPKDEDDTENQPIWLNGAHMSELFHLTERHLASFLMEVPDREDLLMVIKCHLNGKAIREKNILRKKYSELIGVLLQLAATGVLVPPEFTARVMQVRPRSDGLLAVGGSHSETTLLPRRGELGKDFELPYTRTSADQLAADSTKLGGVGSVFREGCENCDTAVLARLQNIALHPILRGTCLKDGIQVKPPPEEPRVQRNAAQMLLESSTWKRGERDSIGCALDGSSAEQGRTNLCSEAWLASERYVSSDLCIKVDCSLMNDPLLKELRETDKGKQKALWKQSKGIIHVCDLDKHAWLQCRRTFRKRPRKNRFTAKWKPPFQHEDQSNEQNVGTCSLEVNHISKKAGNQPAKETLLQRDTGKKPRKGILKKSSASDEHSQNASCETGSLMHSLSATAQSHVQRLGESKHQKHGKLSVRWSLPGSPAPGQKGSWTGLEVAQISLRENETTTVKSVETKARKRRALSELSAHRANSVATKLVLSFIKKLLGGPVQGPESKMDNDANTTSSNPPSPLTGGPTSSDGPSRRRGRRSLTPFSGEEAEVDDRAILDDEPEDEEDEEGEDLMENMMECKLTLPHEEVLVAASYLEGSAARWLSGLVQLQGYGHDFRSWAASQKLEDFLKMVEERWHDPQEAQKATDAILTLHTRQFKSVMDATNTVERLICVPGVRYDPQQNPEEGMYLVYVSAAGELVKMPPEIEGVVAKYPYLFEEPTGVVEKEVVHAIEIIPGSSIPKGRIYRMSQGELDELRRQLKELIEKGWIQPIVSPYGFPVLFVPKKKEGTLKMCIDYRGLNAITVKNREPLPRIDDLLDRVQGCRYFSKIDLKSGYHQIAIRPEDQHKIAFQTRYGLYEFVVMPFGLRNAPGTFQHAMNRIFHDYLDKFVVVYLDDILIFSKTVEEHVAHLDKVLSLLRQHKFKINGEKCEFGRTRILYLGHEISAEGLKPDDAKVASIRDWPRPQSVTEMRSFLGMTGYYRTFVKNYSIVAAPLTDLTRLDTPWEWTDECEAAFRHLKHALTHYEVLQLPDPDKPFIVTTDASQYGIGAVLAQQEGPKLRPVEYMSKKMPSQKLAKSTYEKELYAVYKALTHWRHYLVGRFFILRTDHQTLKWMRTQPVLSDALKRWIEVIEQYDFDPQYLKGEYNKVADALSRRPDFSGALITEFSLTDNVTQSLVEAYREDQFMAEIIRRLEAKDKKTSAKFELVNGLLFLENAGNKRLYGDEDEERARPRRRARAEPSGPSSQAEDDGGEDDGDIESEDYSEPRGDLREWVATENVRRWIARKFRHFLMSHTDKNGELDYKQRVDNMCMENRQSLEVDYMDLMHTYPVLAVWLADASQPMLEVMEEVAKEVVFKYHPNYEEVHNQIYVRITGLPVEDKIRDIRQLHLNTLIKISGVVTRRTGVFPQLQQVKYDCAKCGFVMGPYFQNTSSEVRVGMCPECQSRGPFSVNVEQTVYRNYQKLTLQESPGTVPAGRLPRYKEIILLHDLIDYRCEAAFRHLKHVLTHNEVLKLPDPDKPFIVTTDANQYGIGAVLAQQEGPKLRPVEYMSKSMSSQKLAKPTYEKELYAIYKALTHLRHYLLGRFRSRILLTGLIADNNKLNYAPLLLLQIIKSIAPSIYGHENIKTAIALAMLGGQEKNVNKKHRLRGDINVLLLGDPGTAKSQFLKYVEKTAQRVVYTTGKGASAVGLTAAVHRDPVTHEWTLEGGALVLADKGVCLIDEFDKMNDQDRVSIHEAMEQQSISISKAGIVTSLQARCSVIAAANPIGGRYDSSKTFGQNVELTEPILSRFDCLLVIKDVVDPVTDEMLAKFVVESHSKSHPNSREREEEEPEEQQRQEDMLSQELLRKYIVYARTQVFPKLHNSDMDKIARVYADLRRESMQLAK